jgi:hypothetical protein
MTSTLVLGTVVATSGAPSPLKSPIALWLPADVE